MRVANSEVVTSSNHRNHHIVWNVYQEVVMKAVIFSVLFLFLGSITVGCRDGNVAKDTNSPLAYPTKINNSKMNILPINALKPVNSKANTNK